MTLCVDKFTQTLILCVYRASNDSIVNDNIVNDNIVNEAPQIQLSPAVSEDELRDDVVVNQNPASYHSPDFVEWKLINYSCDYIASIIFNLLMKLAPEEIMLSVDKTSVCLQIFHFSVECYCTIAKNEALKCENREPLRSKALALLLMGLENILVKIELFEDHINVLAILEKMYGSIGLIDGHLMGAIQLEHETGFIYFSCLMLHKLRKHPSMTGVRMFNLLELRIDFIVNVVKVYFDESSNENSQNLSKLMSVLCKTIYDIRNHDIPLSMKLKKKANKKRKKHSCFHHHENTSPYGCVSERLLLQIMQFATTDHLVTCFQFFQRNSICCCNADFTTVKRIVNNAKSRRLHKLGLNFLRNNFLKVNYSNIECTLCESKKGDAKEQKKKVHEFERDLIKLYMEWFKELQNSLEITTLLNHVARTSKYLSFEASWEIVVDIVLPPFRAVKDRYMESDTNKAADGEELIESCLNVFLCLLKDVRLIKGFFNAENVQDMEDLIVFPQFASLTCCLLKIGMENLSFLGENPSEQAIMSERLRKLHSNTILNISSSLFLVFDEIERFRRIGLKITENQSLSEYFHDIEVLVRWLSYGQ